MAAPGSAPPDDTPTVEIDLDPVHTMEAIDRELDTWRARFTLARNGVGLYTVKGCTLALNRWLDLKLDALERRGR